VWLNGHDWAVKRQALRDAIGYTELENGFASCSDPERLQAICDTLGQHHIQAFFDRWSTQLPTPLIAGSHCRLLVGALDAPGRDLAHARAR
jgi:hypothetical protein